MAESPSVTVHLLPSLIPPGGLRGGLAVVADVLRATSAMVHALGSGAEAILPCLEVDEARAAAEALGPGRAILGGERQGLPIDGFDLGNSPASYTPDACRGKTLVMTTTNGTRAILAALEAERVLIGAFGNFKTTLRACRTELAAGRPIHAICAGTDGLVSWEDTLYAGALVEGLDAPEDALDDSARLARTAWRNANRSINYRDFAPEAFAAESDLGSEATRSKSAPRRDVLARVLGEGRGGRRVQAIGLAADLADAADLDRFPGVLAELRRDPTRIVATTP